MRIRTTLTSILLLWPCVSLADCEPLIKSIHYVDLKWQAPDCFEDGNRLTANTDLTGYEIWLVDVKQGTTTKKKMIATAKKDDLTCRVYAPDAGDQHVAMIAIGHEQESRLSDAAIKKF